MKRLLSIALLGTAALLPLTAQAQRGGGMGRSSVSAPARSGFRSAPPSARPGTMGVRPAPGMHTIAPVGRGFTAQHFNRPFGPARFNHFRFHNHRFFGFNDCVFPGDFLSPFRCNAFFSPFAFGTPFIAGYPGYAYAYDNGYDFNSQPVSEYANVPQAQNNDVELAMAVQKLSDQVEDMREEQRQRNQPGPAVYNLSPAQPSEAAVFIFRDGRKISAKNYAIAGQTLWIFNERISHKYALGDLDRAATEQANAANGVEIRFPEDQPQH